MNGRNVALRCLILSHFYLFNDSPTELKVTMKNLGQELTDDQLKLMIQEADCNGDGVIDFEGTLAYKTKKYTIQNKAVNYV